jgi:hypothetical protein
VLGPVIGAAIAVIIIGLVRGLPGRAEQAAAEGDACRKLSRPDRPGTDRRGRVWPSRPVVAGHGAGLP